MKRILASFLFATTFAGCGLLPDQVDETAGWSANKLYARAKESLADANYTQAVQYFEKLEARYPYGPYAQQAQLEIAYAYYKDNEPISAVAACERFIKLHPNHPHVDYAYYLKGLANFVEDRSLLASLGDQDMSERDPRAAREAFESFKELATRFPKSAYTQDAVARMKYLVNALAAHEVHVARYYYRRGAYVAAVNRAKETLNRYQQTPAVEEALSILARSYDALGMQDLRDDSLRVLKANYPNSQWLDGKGPVETRPWWKVW